MVIKNPCDLNESILSIGRVKNTNLISPFNPSNAEATFIKSTLGCKDFWIKNLNPVILVFTCWVLSDRCQGFIHFFRFLHHFLLAKLATSSNRVQLMLFLAGVPECWPPQHGWQSCSAFLSPPALPSLKQDKINHKKGCNWRNGFLRHFQQLRPNKISCLFPVTLP